MDTVPYEGAVPAIGYIVVTGSGASNGADTLSATIGTTTVTTSAFASNVGRHAAASTLATAINANGTIAALGRAVAYGGLNGGAVVAFIYGTNGTAGNAVAISASGSPGGLGHLNAVATTSTLTGGAASGATPTVFTPDSTRQGRIRPTRLCRDRRCSLPTKRSP